MLVDGPPAATGKHARYPALLNVLKLFAGRFVIHFLLDDYMRTDEQEIIVRWSEYLSARKLPYVRTEFNKLEKKACLIEVISREETSEPARQPLASQNLKSRSQPKASK